MLQQMQLSMGGFFLVAFFFLWVFFFFGVLVVFARENTISRRLDGFPAILKTAENIRYVGFRTLPGFSHFS